MNKKALKITGWVIGGIIGLIILIVITFFSIKFLTRNFYVTEPEEWMNKYADILMQYNADDIELQLIYSNDIDNIPVLLMEYDGYFDDQIIVCKVDEYNETDCQEVSNVSNLKILYNIERQKYEFYLYGRGFYYDTYVNLNDFNEEYNVYNGYINTQEESKIKFNDLFLNVIDVDDWIEFESFNVNKNKWLRVLSRENNNKKNIKKYLTPAIENNIKNRLDNYHKDKI